MRISPIHFVTAVIAGLTFGMSITMTFTELMLSDKPAPFLYGLTAIVSFGMLLWSIPKSAPCFEE